MISMPQKSGAASSVSIRGIRVLGDRRVRLLFSDGLVRDLDLNPTLTGPAFERHRLDAVFFRKARIGHGTVTWPDGSDLDPMVLHRDELPAVGQGPRVLGEPGRRVASERPINAQRAGGTRIQ